MVYIIEGIVRNTYFFLVMKIKIVFQEKAHLQL